MFQVDSSIIGTANLIMIGVGQLCFNPVRLELTSYVELFGVGTKKNGYERE